MDRKRFSRIWECRRPAVLLLEAARDVVWDAVSNFAKNAAFNQAAAIALYALLSIFPLFLLSVLAAGKFLGANTDIQARLIDLIKTFHPYFDADLFSQLGKVESKSQVLGWLGVGSLLWSASMIFGAVETALNMTFRAEKHRNVVLSKLYALGMIPLGWIVGITSVLLTYVTTLLTDQVGLVEGRFLHLDVAARFVLQYAVPFLVSALFATIVFLIIPSKRIRLRTILAGSSLFALLVEIVKHAFTWYVANYTRYNAIFGSVETVVILVIWVYYMALIFLFCAEVMSSYERRDMLLIERMLLEGTSCTGRERLFRKFGRGFRRGTVICREGDHSEEMYVILSGVVRLEVGSRGGAAKTLTELEHGRQFGEMAAITGAPRSATATAVTDCEIAVIDGSVYRHLLRESDDFAVHMLKEFAGRITHTNASLDNLHQAWIRLAVLLILLRRWRPGAEQDLAALAAQTVGEERGEIINIFGEFAQQGVLTLEAEVIRRFEPERAWGAIRRLIDQRAIPPEQEGQGF